MAVKQRALDLLAQSPANWRVNRYGHCRWDFCNNIGT
jgi:hypothetical protein